MLAFIRVRLNQAGYDVVVTREPGGTALGERVRDILLNAHTLHVSAETEALLMFAARAEHLERVIRPALEAGKTVLCDRFTDATYAYQGAVAVACRKSASPSSKLGRRGALRPNLTLLLDVPVDIAP